MCNNYNNRCIRIKVPCFVFGYHILVQRQSSVGGTNVLSCTWSSSQTAVHHESINLFFFLSSPKNQNALCYHCLVASLNIFCNAIFTKQQNNRNAPENVDTFTANHKRHKTNLQAPLPAVLTDDANLRRFNARTEECIEVVILYLSHLWKSW